MHVPAAFAVTDPADIDAMIAEARLGLLVTHGPRGLWASHLPFLWDPRARTLTGHLARANPHRERAGAGEALVVFSGPEAYVSPGWYPTKATDPRQAPTWNYEAVHVRGTLEWFDAPDRLRALLAALSDRHERDRPEPWRLEDAPADYVERQLRGIVGVTLRVTEVTAKRKLSQNRAAEDRAGVRAGLAASPDPRDRLVAARMDEA